MIRIAHDSNRDVGGYLIFLKFSKMLKNFRKFSESYEILETANKNFKTVRNIREELLVLYSLILKRKIIVLNLKVDKTHMHQLLETMEDNFWEETLEATKRTYERLEETLDGRNE